MIHRHTQIENNLEPELEVVMHIIQMVNFIEEHALPTRLFRDLCEDGKDKCTVLLSDRGAVSDRVVVAFTW